ncbi:MAG: NACHT domain-containing protein, partial [Methylococcales bacterium]
MNQNQLQAFKHLLADNGASTRWLDPVFDNREQRAWLNHYREFLTKIYSPADFAGVADASQQTPMALARIYIDEQFSLNESALHDVDVESGKNPDSESGLYLEDLLIEFNPDHSPRAVNGKAVIIGAPGSGKSTLVKMLAVACSDPGRVAHARYLGRRLVIPFILRELDLKGIANTDQLLQRWAERVHKQSGGHYRIDLDPLRFYLQKGWAIIAFDGVDEIGMRFRRRVRRLAFAFAERYPDCALLITGRPVGFEKLPFKEMTLRMIKRIRQLEDQPPFEIVAPNATGSRMRLPRQPLPNYSIRPFSEQQISGYIEQWYRNRYPHDQAKQEQESRELQDSLAKQSNLATLKRRPIYLASLTYIHDVKGRLPNSQVLAYKTMVEAYLDVLDAAKRFDDASHPEEASKNFSAEDKTLVLEWLAHDLHCKQTGTRTDQESPFHLRISASEFDDWLKAKLKNELAHCAIQASDVSALRRYFIARSGLLVEPEENILSFSHLSFQEYLAGAWIFRQIGNHQFDLPPFLKQELLDRILEASWHPVGIAFFGLQSRQQGGSFQETLLKQSWLIQKPKPLAEFDFLYKLISEGEPRFSPEFLRALWAHYWEIACRDLSDDWIDTFAKACQNPLNWFEHASV